MEGIEARALKSSFLSQMTVKTNTPAFCGDDVWCFSAINGVSSDDFPVEDLLNLDFSDKELPDESFFPEDEVEKGSQNRDSIDFSSAFSGTDELDSLSAGEICLPVEDLENLEWLSQFVDDSTSAVSLLCTTGSFSAGTEAFPAPNRNQMSKKPVVKTRVPCFTSMVPGKARSKRSRENGRPWSLASPALSSEESSSASSISISSQGSTVLSPFLFANPLHEIEWLSAVEPPPVKKRKTKPETDGGLAAGRRCSHCQVQKTPQWRAGPLGPKTLCNACGVRFKSGRLFPEYRPACSPTFSLEIHSNSHRKVLEMRRRNEAVVVAEPELVAAGQS